MRALSSRQLNSQESGHATKKTWFFLFALLILYSIMPIVSRAISSLLTTYFMLAVLGAVWIYFLDWKSTKWIGLILPLLLVAVIETLDSYFTRGNIILTVYGFLLTFAPILIALRVKEFPAWQASLMTKIAFGAILITVVTSIVGLSSNPGAARYLATVENAADAMNVRYGWMNIGGFSFTYLLLTVYPVVIGYAKEVALAKWKRFILFLLLLVYFISAEYATALLGFCILSMLWFMPKHFSRGRVLAILLLLLIVLLLLKDPIGEFFYHIGVSISSDTLSDRFIYMSYSLRGIKVESDVALRGQLFERSWQGFLNHPIFGNWYRGNVSGGHSYLLDFICQYGLAGIGMQFAAYATIYHLFYRRFKYTSFAGYAAAAFFTAIILSAINTGNHWFELTLLIPMILSRIPSDPTSEEANV